MPKKNFAKKNMGEKVPQTLLEKKQDIEEYAVVTKVLGGGKFTLKMNGQNREVIGRLCGKMKQGKNKSKNWVGVDSVVLVGMRDFQETIVDIVHVYMPSEIRKLQKSGKLVEEVVIREETEEEPEAFVFDEL